MRQSKREGERKKREKKIVWLFGRQRGKREGNWRRHGGKCRQVKDIVKCITETQLFCICGKKNNFIMDRVVLNMFI